MTTSDSNHSAPTEGSTVNNSPEVPETTEIPTEQPTPSTTPEKRSWRRFARGRKVMVAGAAVSALAIGGIGFGAGYAVGDDGGTTRQTSLDQGDRAFPGGDMGGGQMGDMGGGPGGQMGGSQDGTQDGATGQAPDFDGDGEPDETVPDSGTDSGSGSSSDTGTQQS